MVKKKTLDIYFHQIKNWYFSSSKDGDLFSTNKTIDCYQILSRLIEDHQTFSTKQNRYSQIFTKVCCLKRFSQPVQLSLLAQLIIYHPYLHVTRSIDIHDDNTFKFWLDELKQLVFRFNSIIDNFISNHTDSNTKFWIAKRIESNNDVYIKKYNYLINYAPIENTLISNIKNFKHNIYQFIASLCQNRILEFAKILINYDIDVCFELKYKSHLSPSELIEIDQADFILQTRFKSYDSVLGDAFFIYSKQRQLESKIKISSLTRLEYDNYEFKYSPECWMDEGHIYHEWKIAYLELYQLKRETAIKRISEWTCTSLSELIVNFLDLETINKIKVIIT